ncbi:uncharacterized protein LOC134285602 isoform X2 [Aedes albopictus]|uniref:Transposase domain-containing protein n=1 Tax=Aedes albopictus TaxID=7160 RepID=A0ABM1ZF41_AEDAL
MLFFISIFARKMYKVILKSKLVKAKKSGTYSRLLRKYRDRYKKVAASAPAVDRVDLYAEENPITFSTDNQSKSVDSQTINDVTLKSDERNLIADIRKWAAEHHIPQLALKSLIGILNSNLGLQLPKDPRSIMRTPRNIDLVPMKEKGQYWHQGLESCLKRIFRDMSTSMSISLNVNIDGLPIYKSTTKNFWPILCNIYEFPEIAPFTVGIFYGIGKPKDVNEFMNAFVEELMSLIQSGISINGCQLSIAIRCFICDTPARSFIKGVISFNGKYGCLKCTTKGRYSMLSKTMTYPELTAPLRTDAKFRSMEYTDHQRVYTPLVKLPLDMIQDIVVGDSLHLLELGVMKKLLTGWRTGSLSLKAKWSTSQKTEISEYLVSVKFPAEIHRQMRSLEFVSLWKGLEYRNFLNYYGFVL